MLCVGVVFQMTDQAGAEVADISFDLPDILPETVQLGQHNLITVSPAVLAPTNDGPSHDDHQNTDGSDDLSQSCQVLHIPFSRPMPSRQR